MLLALLPLPTLTTHSIPACLWQPQLDPPDQAPSHWQSYSPSTGYKVALGTMSPPLRRSSQWLSGAPWSLRWDCLMVPHEAAGSTRLTLEFLRGKKHCQPTVEIGLINVLVFHYLPFLISLPYFTPSVSCTSQISSSPQHMLMENPGKIIPWEVREGPHRASRLTQPLNQPDSGMIPALSLTN